MRETLGDAATDGLVDLLHRFGDEQRQDLIGVVEERFARRVAESRDDLRGEVHAGIDSLRSEMHAGFAEVQKQFLDHQQKIGNLGKEIAGVRADLTKEIGEVHKAIAVQTRWLLTVLIAATVLIPVMQRVLAAVFP